MAVDSYFLADNDQAEYPIALIGLGRRGCEQVQRLQQSNPADTHTFLIDHDPDSRRDETEIWEDTDWIGSTATVADFSACGLLAIVIVGAEHQDKSEQLSLKLGLLKERPALVLGIILPPPAGQPARLKPELLKELDGVTPWPGDPTLPEWWRLLDVAVSDLVGAIARPGLIPLDITDLIAVFGVTGQPMRVASATVERPAHPERARTATYTALADLYGQGFKPDQATGLLIVILADTGCSASDGQSVRELLADSVPDTATTVVTLSINDDWQDRLRITLFATGRFTPLDGVARPGLSP